MQGAEKYMISSGNLIGKDYLGDLKVNAGIILK
jgi:hypothetical protein